MESSRYTVVFLDSLDRVVGAVTVRCTNDDDAIAAVKAQPPGTTMEIWIDKRRVARVKSTEPEDEGVPSEASALGVRETW
jgi:hypothetical protein